MSNKVRRVQPLVVRGTVLEIFLQAMLASAQPGERQREEEMPATGIEHLPGDIDWCVLFNGSPKPHPERPEEAERPSEAEKTNALQDAQKEVLGILREVQQWPSGDLFERMR